MRRTAALVVFLLITIRAALAQGGPEPLTYGQTVEGKLTPSQVERLYTFTANQGDSIVVTMDATGGTIDPLVILVDESQQTVLAVDNDSGGNRNARLRFVIPVAGKYVIKATAVQGIGEIDGQYKLTLAQNNAAPVITTNTPQVSPLRPGEEARGELNDSVQFHLYTLRVSKGQPITVTLELSTQELQTGMYLYTPDFREVTRAELGQPLHIKASTEALYFLMVARTAPKGAGTYTLHQTIAAPATPSALPAISAGQTVRGTVTNDNAVRTYSLQGKAGQAITARMRRLTGDLITFLYLVATDSGQTLVQGTDVNGVAEIGATLPTDGVYALVATRAGQQSGQTSGDFALSLTTAGQESDIPPALQNYASIDYGDKVTGTINNTTFAVPYVFRAQTGDIVEATMTANDGDLDALLVIQNANGDTLAEDNNGAGGLDARLQITIPQTGYYALIASRNSLADGKTSGKYSLSLEIGAAPAAASALIGIVLSPGELQPAPQNLPVGVLYRFDAPADTAVSVEVNAAEGFNPVVSLTDAEFRQLATANGTVPTTPITRPGTYYVFVLRAAGPNQAASGNFSIKLVTTTKPQPTAIPGTVNLGQPVTGQITNEVYQQRYPIQLKQGAKLEISLEAAPGSTLDPLLGLLDPDNNVLAVNDDIGGGLKNSALSLTVPKDGQYTIVVTRAQEAQGTTTGEYLLKVNLKQETPEVLPLRYGGIASGEITAAQFLYYYVFQGQEGDVVSIKMNHVPGQPLDPVLYLYDYTGGQPKLIATNNDVVQNEPDAAILDFKLPRSGPYLIAATRLNAAKGTTVGNFVLTLTKAQ